ncbi:MAG: orotidine-5'-phosphate decarboxylase [Rhodovibrionaceae bacterium]
MVEQLGDSVSFYKLGLEIFMAGGYFELIDWLGERGKKSFVDLKFFDVPQTVGSAVRQLRGKNVQFITVHGNQLIFEEACKYKNGIKILAVTVLTSLDQSDIDDLGFSVNVDKLVFSRARRALEAGCDGVISSGMESRLLRDELGEKFIIVVPGIRPVENRVIDDQKRTVDVEEAFLNGADYIVVGRPIRNADNPMQAAEDIQERIKVLFEPKSQE